MQWYGIYIIIAKEMSRSIVGKYWNKPRLKLKEQISNFVALYPMLRAYMALPLQLCCLEHTFLSPTPLYLVPLLVSSSPWQKFYSSDISNILGSTLRLSLHSHSIIQLSFQVLQAWTPLPPHLSCYLKPQGKIYETFILVFFKPLKPTSWEWLCQLLLPS